MHALVLALSLAASPAVPKPPLLAAGDALARGDLAAAAGEAERAVAAAPEDPRALQLLAAILERSGAGRAAQVRRKAGPSKVLPLAAPTPAKVGETLFVAAPRVTLRRRPSVAAAAAGWLGWGARVEVRAVDGEFARLRHARLARGSSVLELRRPGLKATPVGAAADPKAWEEVWVHRGYLAPRPITPGQMIAEGQRLAATDPDAALRLLDGAGEMGMDDALRERLVSLALERGVPALAVKAASPLPQGRAAWGEPIAAEARFLLGCRGDRRRAVLVPDGQLPGDGEGGLVVSALPPDACVEGYRPFEGCPPLEVEHPYSDYSMNPAQEQEGGGGEDAGVTREAAEASYAAGRAAYDEQVEKAAAWKGTLVESFRDGPWARVILRNVTDGYAPPVWRLELMVTKEEDCEDHRVLTEVRSAEPLDLPPLPPRSTVELWIELPQFEGAELHLSLSPAQEDVFLGAAAPSAPDCRVLCM